MNFVCYFKIAGNRKTFRKLDLDNLEMIAMPIMLEKLTYISLSDENFEQTILLVSFPRKADLNILTIIITGTYTLFKKSN